MTSSALIDRARRGYQDVGRGVVVMLLEDAEPRYVPAEQIKTSLAEVQVEPELLFGVFYATRKDDPKWEAVLVLEQEDCLTITIVGHQGSEIIRSVSWTSVN